MKTETEIILNNECIETVDGLIPLNKGEKFYFAIRGTCPKSENDYIDNNKQYKEEFLRQVIDTINRKAKKFHIDEFEVIEVRNSYKRDYTLSIDNPSITFVKSITVKSI